MFAFCGIFVQEYSIGEALVHAWRILWDHMRRIVWFVILFVVVDLVLIAVLIGVGAVTYESAFSYTVTQEMAEANRNRGAEPVEPGSYFAITRPINGYEAAISKGRGVNLLSIPLYCVENPIVGVVVVVLGIPLLLLRIAVPTVVYIDLSEPKQEMSAKMGEVLKDRLAATRRTSRG